MSWKDRIQPEIRLISPNGTEFRASWVGDPRTLEKRLGVFEYPGIPGAVIQDMGAGPDSYTINLYFEGEDHDVVAESFFEACRETGPWTVNHPVKGTKTLQLLRTIEDADPVNSANITHFTTEWLEPESFVLKKSPAQIRAELPADVLALQDISSDSLELNLLPKPDISGVYVPRLPGELHGVKQSVEAFTELISSRLESLYKQSSETYAKVLGIKRGITSTLAVIPLDVLGLSGQVHNLIVAPLEASTDIYFRMDLYNSLISDAILTIGDSSTDAMREQVLTSIMSAMMLSIASGESKSREESLLYVNMLYAAFDRITQALDDVQDVYAGRALAQRYFSQTLTYTNLALNVSKTGSMLIQDAFALAAARVFRLTAARAPVEIAADKYGDFDHLDFFISSNKLTGSDILLLPAGREVVVYQ